MTVKKQRHPKPLPEVVRKMFTYRNGQLFWNVKHGPRTYGDIAGAETDFYIMIKIAGVLHNARDLIWIYHNGAIPHGGLKYINKNKKDNRIENIAPRKPKVSFM